MLSLRRSFAVFPCGLSLYAGLYFSAAGAFCPIAQAQTPLAQPTPAGPFLAARSHETVEFSRTPKRTLHIWQMQSRGAGYVETRLWYIAKGKANLLDQQVLWWDKKPQAGTWRLLMLEQAAVRPTFLPSYDLQAVFDDSNDAPNSRATGTANYAARNPIRIPGTLNVVTAVNRNEYPGISPNRVETLYVAETLQSLDAKDAVQKLRENNPKPVQDLTERSRREPGTVFTLLTVLWKPSPTTPRP